MKKHPPEKLITERCILKRPEPADSADLFAIYGDRVTMRYMQMPVAESVGECEKLIGEWNRLFSLGTSFRWGIFLKEDPCHMAGTAALHYWSKEHRRIELGADLHRDCHGQGIATEVTSRLIDCAFSDLGVNRIEIRCHPGNTGSARIAEKLGFALEGFLRQYVTVPGKGLVDEAVYSLLADEHREHCSSAVDY